MLRAKQLFKFLSNINHACRERKNSSSMQLARLMFTMAERCTALVALWNMQQSCPFSFLAYFAGHGKAKGQISPEVEPGQALVSSCDQ